MTVKHSVDSKSVDVALCKNRLDVVVDKNMADVITKLTHIPIKNSSVHQNGQNLNPNENQQSSPIFVSGNATRAQIPGPGHRVSGYFVSWFYTTQDRRSLITASKAYPSSNEHEKIGICTIVRGCRSDMAKHAALTNTFNLIPSIKRFS